MCKERQDRGEHAAGLRIDFLDAILGDLKTSSAIASSPVSPGSTASSRTTPGQVTKRHRSANGRTAGTARKAGRDGLPAR